jgi:protein TonB
MTTPAPEHSAYVLIGDEPRGAATTRPRSFGRARFAVAVALALAGHGAVLAGLSVVIAPEGTGGGGTLLDAIGVSIVDASVLASRETEATRTARADAVDRVAPTEGAVATVHDAASAAAAPAPEAPEKAAAILHAPGDEGEAPAVRATDASNLLPRDSKTTAETQSTEDHAAVATVSAQPHASGGATAQVTSPQSERSEAGQAAASPGAMAIYARALAAALAKTAPRPVAGLSGRTLVRFTVSPDGRADAVTIAQTSGHGRLDKAAVAAVGKAQLPAPPAGMTEKQRTYQLPFVFR